MTGPLQALVARYDRLAAKGEVAAYGFSWEQISYALVFDVIGKLVAVDPLLNPTEKKPTGTSRLVPQSFKRPGVTPRSFFLWDKTSFAFGITRDKSDKEKVAKALPQHEAFKKIHVEALAGSSDEGLRAFLAFLDSWIPDRFAAAPFTTEMLDTNFIFRLDGDDGFLHERPAARAIWLTRLGSADALEAPCLVTGRSGPIARLHPAIKGVMGAQSSGASLVSFNLDAFTSHGKDQGGNAPVSEAAAFGYGTALNALLAKGSRNTVRIGDATVVFWAERPEAEAVVRGFFDPPGPDEKGEAAKIRDVLERMAKGRPIEDADPETDPATRFYILGLAPNAARLSIRFWHETSLGELAPMRFT
jgi:CRISPR-associated protein Csd1